MFVSQTTCSILEKINISTLGCGFTAISNSGQISSPGVNQDGYPNLVECTWTVSAEQGRPLKLSFTEFALADRDYVEVCYSFLLY